MNELEIAQLEDLLFKLGKHLNHGFSIKCNNGIHMAMYNDKDETIKQFSATTLKSTVDFLKTEQKLPD